jgi:hypothetical protein
MATRYWIYREQPGDEDDEQISNPFDSEAAAEHAVNLLNQEVEDGNYYVDSPHYHTESKSAADALRPEHLTGF